MKRGTAQAVPRFVCARGARYGVTTTDNVEVEVVSTVEVVSSVLVLAVPVMVPEPSSAMQVVVSTVVVVHF